MHWVFAAADGLSLLAESVGEEGGGSFLAAAHRLPTAWLLLLQSTGSGPRGFSSCSTWDQLL